MWRLLLPALLASAAAHRDHDFEFTDNRIDVKDEGACDCLPGETCPEECRRLRSPALAEEDAGGACVGCEAAARAQFVCGSDNRTYSSLCRLDLHNCVRRPSAPVAVACRGFCPCGARAARCRPARTADRLLDWFGALMAGSGADEAAPLAGDPYPPNCPPEVRWMFSHLDADADGALSPRELFALRHDQRERCLRPFLARCGRGRRGVSRGGWCGCLRRGARPCAALARAAASVAGGWAPACDAAGYYRARQCHAALQECWCVDARGAERPGSRAKGRAHCPPAAPLPPADDEDAPFSGDGAD